MFTQDFHSELLYTRQSLESKGARKRLDYVHADLSGMRAPAPAPRPACLCLFLQWPAWKVLDVDFE